LTRIALVALPDAVLGLDQQTIAHHRHGMDFTAAIHGDPVEGSIASRLRVGQFAKRCARIIFRDR
jgi:hypothetical protein